MFHDFRTPSVNLDGKSILVTGGTGSFGQAFVRSLLRVHKPRRILIFSRDEMKQSEMAESITHDQRAVLREQRPPPLHPLLRHHDVEVLVEAHLELGLVAREFHHPRDFPGRPQRVVERAAPLRLWPDVRSIVMVGFSYAPKYNVLDDLSQKECGVISAYAQSRDYHDVIKGRLKRIAQDLVVSAKDHRIDVKVFVDTAPVMEKPLAAAAGLGWQGKHTNLVSRTFGSWLFLGEVLLSAELPFDAPEHDHCGHCRACLDICPTAAFPAPYQLDARRCISYLTIEHEGPIDEALRRLPCADVWAYTKVDEVPYDFIRKRLSVVVERVAASADGDRHTMITKGALRRGTNSGMRFHSAQPTISAVAISRR